MDQKAFLRFAKKIEFDEETGCMLWVGAKDTKGYGHFGLEGRTVRSHRLAYEHWKMPIPTGLVIDHLCRVVNCVNPDHLEAVTTGENTRRGLSPLGRGGVEMKRSRTHCPAGHPYSGANLILSEGRRRCRACRYARNRAYKRRIRAAGNNTQS